MKRSKRCGEYSVPLRTISSNDVLLYFFEYDNSTTRISAGFLRIRLRIYAVCLRIRRVFLPYFLRITLVILRIRLLFLLIRLVFLRIRRVFLPYFFGYDNSTTRISSDTTCISSVFLRIGQFYDSCFFGYGAYFFDRTILRLVFLRIWRVFLPYFFGYDLVLLPYFFGYTVCFRRISSVSTILRLVFIPYILHTEILRLVFLFIPAVILQYYLVFENPTARISSDEY